MAKATEKRHGFWKRFISIVVTIIWFPFFLVGLWNIVTWIVGEPLKSDMIEIRENVFNWCYDNVIMEIIPADEITTQSTEETEEFVAIQEINSTEEDYSETDEEIAIDGMRLRNISSYKITEYIDFTIPYEWTFGKVEVGDTAMEESIAITNTRTTMIISMQDIEMEKTSEALKIRRDAMMFDLENKYPNYVFEKADFIIGNVAVIKATADNSDTKIYVAIIPVQNKTIIVNYSFNKNDILEGELYFTIAIAEMLESIE
ncbi:MAG: hypothetical protein IKK43_01135 [Clostridia bacterium]|nr:hypothetical protein [Clostridia bacterium]